MSRSIDIEIIENLSKYRHSALILFGSRSRGDFDAQSDIDILEITENPHRPYSVDHFNYSTYTLDQLINMAQSGSLFVWHIITEGKVIIGDKDIITQLEQNFIKPNNYDDFRNEILSAARLLDISQLEYIRNEKGYYGLLCYLFRSYLYSLCADENRLTFSIKEIAKMYKDSRLVRLFNMKYQKHITFDDYSWCKKIFESYTNTKFINKYGDSSILLNKIKKDSKFTLNIGVHFLKDSIEDISY